MLSLFARRPSAEPASLYGSLVAHARRPIFYTEYGVPDTLDGRFDLLILHAWMIFRRLGHDGGHGRALAQATFDLLFADLDSSLREMGVGDLTVPKKIRRMTEAFYGRIAAYDAALNGGSDALEAALARNVLGNEAAPARAGPLARYVEDAVKTLDEVDTAALFAGRLTLPEPVPVASEEGSKPCL